MRYTLALVGGILGAHLGSNGHAMGMIRGKKERVVSQARTAIGA